MVEIVSLLKEDERTHHDSQTWHKGTIFVWHPNRGYGFIELERRSQDPWPGKLRVFVHRSCLQRSKIKEIDMEGGKHVLCTTTQEFGRPSPQAVTIKFEFSNSK